MTLGWCISFERKIESAVKLKVDSVSNINFEVKKGDEFVNVYKGTLFNEEHSRKSQQNYDSL